MYVGTTTATVASGSTLNYTMNGEFQDICGGAGFIAFSTSTKSDHDTVMGGGYFASIAISSTTGSQSVPQIPLGSHIWVDDNGSCDSSRSTGFNGSGDYSSSTNFGSPFGNGTYPGNFFPNLRPYLILDTGSLINLEYPTNGITSPDFTNWVISFNDLPTSTSGGAIGVWYSMSSSSVLDHSGYDDAVFFSQFVNANPLKVYKHLPLWFPPLTIPATWYAQAAVTNSTGDIVATSSLITFYIDPDQPAPTGTTAADLAAPFSTLNGETSSTPPTTTSCTFTSSSILADPVGNIQQGICQAFSYLFVPNSQQQKDMLTRYNNIFNAISKKPPFGYVGSASDALNNFNYATSSTSTQLLDATGTAVLSSSIGTLDDGMALIISLLVLFWIFNRGRHIEL